MIRATMFITSAILIIVAAFYILSAYNDFIYIHDLRQTSIARIAFILDFILSIVLSISYGYFGVFSFIRCIRGKEVSEKIYFAGEIACFAKIFFDMMNTIIQDYDAASIYHWVIMIVALIPLVVIFVCFFGTLDKKVTDVVLIATVVFGVVLNISVLTLNHSDIKLFICLNEILLFMSYISYYATKLYLTNGAQKIEK